MNDLKNIYKKLNHYDYHSEAIRYYNYLLTYPRNSPEYRDALFYLNIKTNSDLRDFYKKFHGFVMKDRRLYYDPLKLEVVPYNAKEDIKRKLKELYDSSEGLGKGEQAFYHLVASKYLGIGRDDCIKFLKSQTDYQLTRKPKKQYQKPLNANSPFSIVAIDLVDLNPYIKIKENKNYRYILTIIDLFSNYTWFFPIKKKEPKNIVEAFEDLFAQSGNLRPRLVISDGGSEFKGDFLTFLNEHHIKKLTTRSYTPQPNVEKANQILRQIMRHVFVRYQTLAWFPHLKEIQASKNSFYDARLRNTPDGVMTAFENGQNQIIDPIAEKKKERIKAKVEKFNKAVFKVGDFVRIKLSSVQSELRKRIKDKQSKYIVANYSPQVYEVFKVWKPNDDKLGLPKYSLMDTDTRILITPNNRFKRFKQSDLIKVSPDSTEIHPSIINKLNMLDNPDYFDAQGDIELKERERANQLRVRERPVRERVVKEIKNYNEKDWNTELEDKVFTEMIGRRKMKWKITKVKYSRTYKTYMVYYLPQNSREGVEETESSTLKEILQDAKQNGDEWYKLKYDSVITGNTGDEEVSQRDIEHVVVAPRRSLRLAK